MFFLYGATAFKAHHGGASAERGYVHVEFLFQRAAVYQYTIKISVTADIAQHFGTK